jgi:hypothetical protein
MISFLHRPVLIIEDVTAMDLDSLESMMMVGLQKSRCKMVPLNFLRQNECNSCEKQ